MKKHIYSVLLFLPILLIFFDFSSCSYMLGPAGADGQPKISNVVYNLKINGSNAPIVYLDPAIDPAAVISWDLISDAGVKYFQVDVNGDGIYEYQTSSYLLIATIGPTADFTDLTVYNIRVRSIDKKDQTGDWSAPISLIIDSIRPDPPTGCDITAISTLKGTVTWSQVDSPPSIVKSYNVSLIQQTPSLTEIYNFAGNVSKLRKITYAAGTPTLIDLAATNFPATQPPLKADLTFMAAGTYQIKVTAIDSSGRESNACTSAWRTIP